jgi:hypothetical protein
VTSRFISNLLVSVYATFLLVACFAFRPPLVGWLGFAMSCATVVTVLVAFAFGGRGPVARMIDVILAVIGAWTIVASRAYSGGTVKWLSFSSGAALWGLAVIGLIVHELLAERTLSTVVELPRSGARQAQLRDQRRLAAR